MGGVKGYMNQHYHVLLHATYFQELPVRPSGNPPAMTTPTAPSPINTPEQQLAEQAKVNQLSSPMPPLQVSVLTMCNNHDLGSTRDTLHVWSSQAQPVNMPYSD
jgi:hypothetical protein